MEKDELEKILKENHNLFYKIAFSKLKNKDDTEDVIAETEYIAIKEINKLRDKNKFLPWIISILNNECKRFYRQRKYYTRLYSKVTNNMDTFDYAIEDFESRKNFEDLIKNLKEDEKKIFRLYFYENYTTEEISEILDLNQNTVKSKLRRGKENLKTFIKNNSKKFALFVCIAVLFTSGIAISKSIMDENHKKIDNYKVIYNNDEINKIEYEMYEDELEINLNVKTVNEFKLFDRNDAICLIDMDKNKTILYPSSYEWKSNILSIKFKCNCEDLGSNLSLRIMLVDGDSITIMLKK